MTEITISDITNNVATVSHGGSSASVAVPTQSFTSTILPCLKDEMMDRVYEAGRLLRAKEIRLVDYFELLNGARESRWVVVVQ